MTGLGAPASEAGHAAIAAAAKRAEGSVRQALVRLAPESGAAGALIDEVVAGLPRPDPRAVARLADAVGGRAGDEAYLAFHRELYGWFVRYARDVAPGSPRVEEIGGLWDRIRDAERETEALNLDRKLHILALVAEIAATRAGTVKGITHNQPLALRSGVARRRVSKRAPECTTCASWIILRDAMLRMALRMRLADGQP